MSAQLDIFGEFPPFQRHSTTSKAAAGAIEPKTNALQARVYARLRHCAAYGATDEELQDFLRLNPSTERPRRIELVAKHLVKDSGRTRKTRSGREAVVWICDSERAGEMTAAL